MRLFSLVLLGVLSASLLLVGPIVPGEADSYAGHFDGNGRPVDGHFGGNG